MPKASRLLLLASAALFAATPAAAQKSQTQLQTEISTLLPSGRPSQFSAANIRQVLDDIVLSMQVGAVTFDPRGTAGLAACSGNTDASPAIAASIAAGHDNILLPAGCFYQPPTVTGNEVVPNGITIVGQNSDPNLGPVSRVQTADRTNVADFLELGARSGFQNVAIQSNWCDVNAAPASTQKLCPLGVAYNSGDQAQTVTNWTYEAIFYTSGTTSTQSGVAAANDVPIIALIMNNTGDAIYIDTSGAGVGVRLQTGGTSGDQAILLQNGVVSSPSNVHTGIHCLEYGTNVSSSCLSLERSNGATAFMSLHQDDGPSTATTDWDRYIVSYQSGGNIRNTFQGTTAFSGIFDFINAGNSGGTFTGQYQNYAVAGVTKWLLDANSLNHTGAISLGKPVTICGGGNTYAQLNTDYSLISTDAATCTVTLLSAATFPGRIIDIKATGAGAVASATSNVVPIGGGAAGTAILSGSGKWARLQSDASSWIVLMAN